jgi:hypothetical protein
MTTWKSLQYWPPLTLTSGEILLLHYTHLMLVTLGEFGQEEWFGLIDGSRSEQILIEEQPGIALLLSARV